MRGLASLVREDRAQSIENVWGPQWGEYPTGGTYAGKAVTPLSSLQLLAVYGSVQFIVDGISTLPMNAFRKTAAGREPVAPPLWLDKPAPDLDRIGWMTQILVSLTLAGNAYLYVSTDAGRLQLIPLDPSKVSPAPSMNGRRMWIVGGQLVDGGDIVHIPGIMFPGSPIGLSPVEAARQTIGQGLAAQEYSSRAVGQSFSAPGVIETTEPLTPENAKALARNAARQHTGPDKMNLPLVLVNAQWKPIGVTQQQAQFLESRQFTDAQIAGEMFLIDPSELGIPVSGTSLTYGNLTERGTRRVQVTFLRWIVRVEEALSALLPPGVFVKINTNALLRGDTKTRYEGYKIGLDEDFILAEEIRAWEELPPLPDRAPAPPALVDQIEAAGQLIRAGFEPSAALAFLGLPPIAHTGLVPITVTQEQA
jgi:HK97 family phage portal protein